NDELQLNALKDAVLTSSAGKITIAAKEEILITCKGAYIKLANGEVEIGSPKLVRVKAPMEVTGQNSAGVNMKGMPAVEKYDEQFQFLFPDGKPMHSIAYIIHNKDEVITGITTTKGLSHRIHAEKQQELKTELQWADFDSAPPFGDA
ncbi:MAG: DUF2345 domain-containing protein, partial [Neisseria sp.]|nr:DUF2345 domain-containing protein [Neisseria sp.]